MNILITGVAGFIGFSLAHELLRNKKYKIIGIDNLDKYYSARLKKHTHCGCLCDFQKIIR